MGGGVGRWPMEGGQGARGEMGWGHQTSKPNNWSDLAGDEGGGMEGGQGGRRGGGAPESSVGATKVHWLLFVDSFKNLTTGLIWLVTRVGDGGRRGEVAHGEMGALGPSNNWWGDGGRRGEVAHGGRARGEMGGEVHWFPFLGSLQNLNWSDLAGDEGGGMGGGVGRWPMEGGQGGRWGGAPESSVGARKGALVPLFWAPLKT